MGVDKSLTEKKHEHKYNNKYNFVRVNISS